MPPTWFDDARIERTVKREFVCSYLDPEEIENLDKPLLFGDGLTDDTYWDWIQTKARRLFLILIELGLPDQIFGIVDDSWEDDDLPIALDQVHRLSLTEERDLRLEKKFYDLQFTYLLRPLHQGEHIDYRDQELVPLDIVDNKRLAAGTHQDTVELPQCPGKLLSRRGLQLGLHMSREDFMCEISLIRDLQNGHIESYYASYTHHNHAYVLFTPASEYKLTSYLTNTPTVLKNVDKLAKRLLVLDWIHCLIDTLSFIHSKGEALGSIKPSAISFTHDHCVVLPDRTCFNPDILMQQQGNKYFSKEGYDYAAPEQCSRPNPPSLSVRTRNRTLSSAAADSKARSDFTISRGTPIEPSRHPLAPSAPRQLTASFDPQVADIFSLGCIILDLISHGLLKRSSSAFAAVRSAKHKIAGRGGAVLDSSFHKNLGQVEVWMNGLSKDANKKADDSSEKAKVFKTVTPILHVVERMLAVQPGERPSAAQVQAWVYQILTEVGALHEPHCVHQYGREKGDSGVGESSCNSDPSSPIFDSASTHQTSSAPTIVSKRSSLFSIRTLGHRRAGSDEIISGDIARDYTSSQEGDQSGLGSGWLNSVQNLRIGSSKSRLWQSPSHSGSAVSS